MNDPTLRSHPFEVPPSAPLEGAVLLLERSDLWQPQQSAGTRGLGCEIVSIAFRVKRAESDSAEVLVLMLLQDPSDLPS